MKPVNRVTRTFYAVLLLSLLGMLISACNFNVEEATPTAEGIIEQNVDGVPEVETLTPTISPTPPAEPSSAPTREVAILETPLPSFTPGPPTETETLTPTEGPVEHVIQSGESLWVIMAQYGYFDFSVEAAVKAINPGIPDLNNLQAGRILLIPQMTATPTPVGFEMTNVANATLGITPFAQSFDNVGCHTVVEGDRIITIAVQYNTTLEVLSQLNRTLYFPPTCDFTNRSGGPDCSVNIQLNTCVNVPFPTATPTLSPTPSGDETATPTPTYAPPRMVYPPQGAIVNVGIPLQWVSVGALASDEVYFIQIYDVSQPDAAPVTGISRTNSYQIPASMAPVDGQERTYEWTVAVARRNEQGSYRIIGGDTPRQQFRIPG